jgi:hypothetical protein
LATDNAVSEADVEKWIVGKWNSEWTEQGCACKSLVIYNKDGTLFTTTTIAKADFSTKLIANGTWKVNGAKVFVSAQVTQKPIGGSSENVQERQEVILINESGYRYRNERGKDHVFTRVTE